MRDWLEARTQRRRFLYLFLYPLGTSGGAWGTEIMNAATTARAKLLAEDPGPLSSGVN